MVNEATETSKIIVERWVDWVRSKEVSDLVSKVDLTSLGREIADDPRHREHARVVYEILWDWGYEELNREERAIGDLIGDELSEELVRFARETDPDEDLARIVFRSPAAEAMFGNVLYEGINEFLSRVDIIGAILDKIPLIGGIKGKVQSNIPDGIGGLVEGRIKQFLGNFSGSACEKALDFVLSPEHIDDVRGVQAEVVRHVINRSVSDFVPDEEQSERWRDAVWAGAVQQLQDVEETVNRLDRFYDEVESVELEECLPEEPPESLVDLLADHVEQFLGVDEAEKWFEERFAESGGDLS